MMSHKCNKCGFYTTLLPEHNNECLICATPDVVKKPQPYRGPDVSKGFYWPDVTYVPPDCDEYET